MPRIQSVEPSTATGETARLFDTAKSMFGVVPNFVRTAGNAPAALDALLGIFKSLGNASIGAKAGEQIAIAVAQANGTRYCLSGHTFLGAAQGLDAGALNDARRGAAPDPKTDALLKLAVAIVDQRGLLDDATLATARSRGVSDGEIMEVVAHVALNVFTNYMNNIADTEIDFPEVSPTSAIASAYAA